MKYEDLTRMYWILNRSSIFINGDDYNIDGVQDLIDELEWCMATIHEELRNLEVYESNC